MKMIKSGGNPQVESFEHMSSSAVVLDQILRDSLRGIRIWPDGRTDTPGAAKYAGVSEKTLMMHRVHGTGPEFVRLGGQKRGKIFYFITALNEWMQSGVVQTASVSPIASDIGKMGGGQ
ncbi:MAG: hypothetical protein EBQ73_00800 [Gammaproteobacteria bacterium]|nr:hypothetical protein [Gammaproteobacteria bacterium]